MARQQGRAFRVHQGVFQGIRQFPDVARPVVGAQGVERLGGNPDFAPLMAAAQVGQQGIHQQRDVLPPLAQGRHMQGQHAQAVIQVGPECPVAHHGGKIPMRGREDADIHLAGLVLAQPLDFPFLQHAQQFHLDIQRHLADLVQQQGAAVGGLETTLARRRRAGEGAAGMAEQFASSSCSGKAAQCTRR
jgi:hypothetical protein